MRRSREKERKKKNNREDEKKERGRRERENDNDLDIAKIITIFLSFLKYLIRRKHFVRLSLNAVAVSLNYTPLSL